MIDSNVFVYAKRKNVVVADRFERKKWEDIGIRKLMRESGLSQAPISKAIQANESVFAHWRSSGRRQSGYWPSNGTAFVR
jgi:hypothetical protein